MLFKFFPKRQVPLFVQGGDTGAARTTADTPSHATSLIDRLEKVPQHVSLLSAGHAKSLIRLGGRLEGAIVVLETAPQRAAILVDPDLPQAELTDALRLIRNKLNVANYAPDAPIFACRAAVIAALLEEHRARLGDRDDDEALSRSKARELWDRIIEIGVLHGATDFHFHIVRNQARVQIRVDGELEALPDGQDGLYLASQIQRAVGWAFSNQSQNAANSASLYNKDLNLYTMIKPRTIAGRQISLRYQHLVGAFGPKTVCRVLHTDGDAPTLSFEALGYDASHIQIWRDVARTASGMILIAGTTGSGKTTALKTFIESHPGNGASAFYSLENPIEYPLKGVHQVPFQIDLLDKADSANQYAEVIASLMRSDPDGVLIGEIRDPASAMAAQQLAETGHLAAATVHAHLLSGIIPRLTDAEIGMSRQVLTNPNMLALLAYQALVPRLCKACHIPATDASQLAHVRRSSNVGDDADADAVTAQHIDVILRQLETRFGLAREHFHFKRQGGCPACRGRGTKGLTIVAEMWIPDRQWLDCIRRGDDHAAVRHYRSFADGRVDSGDMRGKTVFEHALYKAYLGQIDPRDCERFDSFLRFQTHRECLDASP